MNKWIVLLTTLVLPAFASAQITIDFREGSGSVDLDRDALTASEQKELFQRLYPAADSDGCREEFEEPMQAVSGYFTQNDRQEILVAFASSPCGISSGRHGNLLLLSADRQDVKVWYNDTKSDAIELVEDLNGDGLMDVVTSLTSGNQGYWSTLAETFTFKSGKAEYIEGEIGINRKVADSSCAASENGYDYASVLYFQENETIQKNFRTSCQTNERELYSTGPLETSDDQTPIESND